MTNRRSISLLMAITGRTVSGSAQTPATTTREYSGALAMIPSRMPGTPTHSKITRALRLRAQHLRAAGSPCR